MSWSLGGWKALWENGWVYIEAILPQRASGTQTRNRFFVQGDMRKFEFHVTAISNCEFTSPSRQIHHRHNHSTWASCSRTTPQIPCPTRFCVTAKISQYISESSIGYIHYHKTWKTPWLGKTHKCETSQSS